MGQNRIWCVPMKSFSNPAPMALQWQAFVSGRKVASEEEEEEEEGKKKKKKHTDSGNDVLDLIDEKFNCTFMQLPEWPVTTPCKYTSCLKCFPKWVGQGKHTCAKCRSFNPPKMSSQPRINSALVVAVRMAKTARSATSAGPSSVHHFIQNENRPEKAFTTERAKKAGKASACNGQKVIDSYHLELPVAITSASLACLGHLLRNLLCGKGLVRMVGLSWHGKLLKDVLLARPNYWTFCKIPR